MIFHVQYVLCIVGDSEYMEESELKEYQEVEPEVAVEHDLQPGEAGEQDECCFSVLHVYTSFLPVEYSNYQL